MLWTLLLYAMSTTIAFCVGAAWRHRNNDVDTWRFCDALNQVATFPFRVARNAVNGTAPSKTLREDAAHTPPAPMSSPHMTDAA
jgi:hypothetical protein